MQNCLYQYLCSGARLFRIGACHHTTVSELEGAVTVSDFYDIGCNQGLKL